MTALLRLLRPDRRRCVRAGVLLACLVAAGCANKRAVPDWQLEAKGASDRFVSAYLSGQRNAPAEFERARLELARTGRPVLVARLELLHCAAQLASVDLQDCPGFEALRDDAPAAERAYAHFLAGKLVAGDQASLTPAQQAWIAALTSGASGASAADALSRIGDSFSRLVAAGALLRAGLASPAVLQIAVDTASQEGWRRPLLAWLGVQLRLAEQSGDVGAAAHLRRRLALVQPEAPQPKPSATSP